MLVNITPEFDDRTGCGVRLFDVNVEIALVVTIVITIWIWYVSIKRPEAIL